MSIKQQPNYIFASRFSALRKEKGLNQQEFAYDFSKYINRGTAYSFTTISAWELGRKTPPMKLINSLSSYFGVSADYLLGMTTNRQGRRDEFALGSKSREERDILLEESKLELAPEEYKKYDTLPVFASFKNLELKNTWGILDLKNQRIVTINGHIALGQYDIKLYAYPLPGEMYYNFWRIHAYSLQTLLQTNVFWIEVYSNDGEIRQKYSGWYEHLPDKTGIINCNNGLILPYTGLNVSYCAYGMPVANS
jgi:transcriptional regulator with XRE-family HTH domain